MRVDESGAGFFFGARGVGGQHLETGRESFRETGGRMMDGMIFRLGLGEGLATSVLGDVQLGLGMVRRFFVDDTTSIQLCGWDMTLGVDSRKGGGRLAGSGISLRMNFREQLLAGEGKAGLPGRFEFGVS